MKRNKYQLFSRKGLNILGISLITVFFMIFFSSCKKNYSYQYNFLEKLEFPFSREAFLHDTINNYNIRNFIFCLDKEESCIIYESKANIEGNDTTEFKDKCKYIFNREKNLMIIDGYIDDITIKYDTLFNHIQTITTDNKKKPIEYIYNTNGKLITINGYWDKEKKYLRGYCSFKYYENKIIEEEWFDVTNDNTKKVLNRKISYKYDQSKKLINKKIYNSDNILVQEIKFTYKDNLKIVTDTYYHSKEEGYSNIYIYDNSNRLLSKEDCKYGIKDSIEYKIQDNKLFITEKTYTQNNGVNDFKKLIRQQIDCL